MSGGVDSTVSALLLKQQGYDVTGVFMKNWEEDDTQQHCSATQDIEDVQAACDKIGIEFKKINFSYEYWENVFEYFLAEYKQGRTPNPDVLCNTEIKFKAFLNYAKTLNANYIATGHYAKTKLNAHGNIDLLIPKDTNKDQTYFLHGLTQQQLTMSIFPLANITKPEVREIAKQARFANHNKKDSTGICFIGERKFKDFLENYLPARQGDIEDIDGKIIGKHDGIMFYTIGQRKGLGIGGIKDSDENAWYVVDKDITNNKIIVAQGGEHPRLYKTTLTAKDCNFINPIRKKELSCQAKIRYRQSVQDCQVNLLDNNAIAVTFDNPQRAITLGQSIVLYDNEICLGGGVITHCE